MSVNPTFERYSELAIQLQRVELLSLSREEKLAFFINIYNALVIHGYLRLGAPTNMWQRYRVWPGPQRCTQLLFKASFSFILMEIWSIFINFVWLWFQSEPNIMSLSTFFFFFPVLQLCKLSDWRRSLHTAGHWKRCPEREQKRHSTALQTFLQNRSSATSNGSFCQNTVQHFADLLSYTELTGNCVVINCALYCPLGGAAGRWASHSFCPELWGEGLPTNQNLYSTGKQNRCSVNTRIQ